MPRVVNLTEGYLSAARGIRSPESLTTYVQQAQKRDALLLEEVTVLPQALKLAQLEYILDRAEEAFKAGNLPPIEQSPFSAILHSMRRLNQFEWRTVLEPLIAFDSILRQDPCGVFADMEDETRHHYHMRVAELAKHADASEVETAQFALDLARESSRIADRDPRHARRTMHIGYYLFAEGLPLLSQRIDYNPPPIERLRSFLRRWNLLLSNRRYHRAAGSPSRLLADHRRTTACAIAGKPGRGRSGEQHSHRTDEGTLASKTRFFEGCSCGGHQLCRRAYFVVQ